MVRHNARKNRVEDVVSRSKVSTSDTSVSPRSIRNITKEGHTIVSRPPQDIPQEEVVPSRKKIETADVTPLKTTSTGLREETSEAHFVYDYTEVKRPKHTMLYVSLLCLAVILYFAVSALFKKAIITVTPKNQTIDLSTGFTARKNAVGSDLGFQFVTLTKEVQREVVATTSIQVQKKAEGVVVLYNNTKTSQRLVENTRLEANNGLIFRLKNAVVIPAAKAGTGNKDLVAGSVEVGVVADKVGSDYNISFSDFTIPGLKGTSKYTDVYARSKAIFSGGFAGLQKVIAPEEKQRIEQELEAELRTGLATDLQVQIPKEYVLYADSIVYSFSPATQENISGDKVFLTKKGVANAVIFDTGTLSRALVSNALPQFVDDVITVPNIQSLQFTYATTTTATITDLKNMAIINFSLSGKPYFVWSVDFDKLKMDLLGLSKEEAQKVILGNTGIAETKIKTYPFWNGSIPQSDKKVVIKNSLDE